ncbi:MAG TPA: phosphatase PAP2 family protein [Patescibacteria group bacterium]|nr:phosphatase PAP2 family protein [Patescibacteria group bacterium]
MPLDATIIFESESIREDVMNFNVLITFVASLLIWLMAAGVVYLWLFKKAIPRNQVFRIFLAGIMAWILTDIIKKIIPTPRPFMIDGLNALTLTIPKDGSFPSMHASTAFAIAVSFRKSDKKVFIIFALIAILISLGRVFSHVHYYSDVIAGAGVGILAVIIIERIDLKKIRKTFKF